MKTNRMSRLGVGGMLCLWVLLAESAVGQVMYADFENHGTGIIVASPNWRRAPLASKAAVETSNPYAGEKALAMHTNRFGTPEYALVHNFGHTNDASKSPIIRMSTMLYMDRLDDPIKWGLGTGYTNLNLLIRTDPTTHHIIVGAASSGALLVTGRYAQMTLHFDMTADRATMDYDGKTILPWQYCVNSLTNEFNLMHFIRVSNQIPGQVLFDNVIVESFPADTWAWWRFEEGTGTVTRDHLAHYPIQCITNRYGATWVEKDPTWLFSGQNDLLDRSGLEAYAAEIVHPLTNSPMTTNWTIEAVMRCDPNDLMDTPTIVRMLDYRGNAVCHGAAIQYSLGINFTPMITLRDSQESDSASYEHFSSRTPMPADSQWHYIAAVKEDADLRFYLDGIMVTNYALGTVADGGYQFATNSSLYLGRTVSTNEAVRAGQALSELRFTCRALTPGELIQTVHAQIRGFEKQAGANDWKMTLQGNPGMSYDAEVTVAVTNGTIWNSRETISATNVLTTVPISAPTDETIYYRLTREILQNHM